MNNYISATRALTIDDYPLGFQKRGTAVYSVTKSRNGKQERVERTTFDGVKISKPKTTTYGLQCAILTCENGLTYVATWYDIGMISILKSNMQHTEETVWNREERYTTILDMIMNAE